MHMKNLMFLFVVLTIISCKKESKSTYSSETTSEYSSNSEESTSGNATTVFWGDTHLHTNLSMDAGLFGNQIGLDEAYK
ncbi:MAG: DUF3604 domain-containing protein, partial [Urechidicola sp.]|nr:DUF3604 domain-containing protein [Urechidicola sp.]